MSHLLSHPTVPSHLQTRSIKQLKPQPDPTESVSLRDPSKARMTLKRTSAVIQYRLNFSPECTSRQTLVLKNFTVRSACPPIACGLRKRFIWISHRHYKPHSHPFKPTEFCFQRGRVAPQSALCIPNRWNKPCHTTSARHSKAMVFVKTRSKWKNRRDWQDLRACFAAQVLKCSLLRQVVMHGLKANRSLGKRSCKRGLVNEDTWTKIIWAFLILNFFLLSREIFQVMFQFLKTCLNMKTISKYLSPSLYKTPPFFSFP